MLYAYTVALSLPNSVCIQHALVCIAIRCGGDDHLEMLTLAEEDSPVPLLLCHQVLSQPYFRQADKVGQSVKLGHLGDSIRAEMQELQAGEVG